MMNPLEGLEDWHVYLTLALAGCGIIAVIIWIIKGVIWLFNHVTINP